MILRALIVLLVVINLGVAAWWGTRAPPAARPSAETPAGVPRLQLLRESPRPSRPRASGVAPAVATTTATQCFSFGPYPTPAALRRAHERVLPQVVHARVREVASGAPSGWRVFMPPLSTRAEAQALAGRMTSAGIDDLLVLSEGNETNGIALGRYGSEATALRRQADLQKAGFTARVAPLGNLATEGWIDVAAGNDFDHSRVAHDIAAAQAEPLDCTTLAAISP